LHRAAIGIFDSGVGGLTVASAIVHALPHEDIVYLGDTARLPYGTRSPATVVRYAELAVSWLLRYPIKVLVIACNTASAHALEAIRAGTDLPVLGVVEPGARAAAAATRTGRVGVAGTEGTIASGAYQRVIRAALPEAIITTAAWPLLVPLAEEGWVDHPVARLALETYLAPFVEAQVDALVLGCTHYPVFKPLIRQVLEERFGGYPVALVDSADAIAGELGELLATRDLAAPERAGRRTLLCTDAAERFRRIGPTFFRGDLSSIVGVDL
jgi:glutamate racemase